VRSNAMDVCSNVHCIACLEQRRTLARRGVTGERRYATVLEKAEVHLTASTAFDRTVLGQNSRDSTETKNREQKMLI
jgi:hydroxypyruvate isomerase